MTTRSQCQCQRWELYWLRAALQSLAQSARTGCHSLWQLRCFHL